jgi:lysine 2,3-aminomutase
MLNRYANLLEPTLERYYNDLVESDYLLPLKISDFYLEKVRKEISAIGTGGPLYRSVFPVNEKVSLFLPGESRDYINEKSHSHAHNINYIVQKYEERLIFLVSDECFAHCQYCFRTYKIQSEKKDDAKNNCSIGLEEKTEVLINYLYSHPEIKEVILTGGEPLTLSYKKLFFLCDRLKKWKLRIHTRAIVYEPDIFTLEIINLLKEYDIKLVFHINHPYEICDIIKEKINLLRKNHIKMYAQFPLLRGINDHTLVLKTLLAELTELGVRPLSIFCVEPNKYSAAFRINFKRIEKIIDDLNWHSPSWVNSVRFVLDTEAGKVRRENIVRRKGENIVFMRSGKEVIYKDFPAEYDIPGDINKLLWKNNSNEI